MLRRDLHPYSAVHAVRVDVSLDATRLARDIDRLLEMRGLTGLELDAAGRRFEYHGGSHTSTLHVIDGRREPRVTLEREMERQLNLSFAGGDGRTVPLFRGRCGPRLLPPAWRPFVAAGDSIVVLLARSSADTGPLWRIPTRTSPGPCIPQPSDGCCAAAPSLCCTACGDFRPSLRVAGAVCVHATLEAPKGTTRCACCDSIRRNSPRRSAKPSVAGSRSTIW
jgi:hypothetical protein